MIDLRSFLGTHLCKASDSGEDCACPCDCCMGHCPATGHGLNVNHMQSVCAAIADPTGSHVNRHPPYRPPADDRFPAETVRDMDTVTAAEFEEAREAEEAVASYGGVTHSANLTVYDMGDGDDEIDGQGDAPTTDPDERHETETSTATDMPPDHAETEGRTDGDESKTERESAANDGGSSTAPVGQPEKAPSQPRTPGASAQGEKKNAAPRQRATVPITNTRTGK